MDIKRLGIVLNYIKQKTEVRLSDLCRLFPELNEMTLRRDLILLEKNGYIKRIRGGAILSKDSLAESFSYHQRSDSAIEQKRYIAVRALALLKESTSIYLDSSTTVLELAKMIPDMPLFVITNGPAISYELAKTKNIDVLLTGGSLNKTVASLSGPIALDSLNKVNVDTAFISAAGFSLEHGFTNALYSECELKKKAIAAAKNTVMMIDSSKINKSLPYTFAGLMDIKTIVTDKPLPDDIMSAAQVEKVQTMF